MPIFAYIGKDNGIK